MIEIRKASMSDVSGILKIMGEAAAWQKENNTINRWDMSKFTVEWLSRIISENRIIVAELEGEVCGVQMFSTEASGASEGWEDVQGPALYLFKLCVSRKIANEGVAKRLITSCYPIAEKLGLSTIRFDCPDDNNFISYYEALGYSLKGKGVAGPYKYAKLEKSLH